MCNHEATYHHFFPLEVLVFSITVIILLSIFQNKYNGMFAICFTAHQVKHKDHVPYGWIVGGLAVGLALLIVTLLLCFCLRSSRRFKTAQKDCSKDSDVKISHKFHILRTTSLCCASKRSICCKLGDWKQPSGEASNNHSNIPKGCNSRALHLFSEFYHILC